MNEKYATLLKLIAQTMEITAEKAMEQNKEKGELKAYKTSQQMRDNYKELYDNLSNKDYKPTKNDYSNLYIGSHIVVSSIQSRIEKEQASILAYNNDLMPKLKAAMANPEEAENIFSVQEK